MSTVVRLTIMAWRPVRHTHAHVQHALAVDKRLRHQGEDLITACTVVALSRVFLSTPRPHLMGWANRMRSKTKATKASWASLDLLARGHWVPRGPGAVTGCLRFGGRHAMLPDATLSDGIPALTSPGLWRLGLVGSPGASSDPVSLPNFHSQTPWP
jgi:hypothetical protein